MQTEPQTELIYGIRAIEEALAAGRSLERVLLVQDTNSPRIEAFSGHLREANVAVQWVPAEKLDYYARGRAHQGAVAFVASVPTQVIGEIVQAAFERGEVPLVLLLDGVTDVRNLGAIARTAEALGAHALVVPLSGSARLGPDAVKASAGALLHLPVCRVPNLKTTVAELQLAGLYVAALTEKATDSITTLPGRLPIGLLMGDEGKGIAPALLKLCNARLRIPLGGRIGSLNVSVAAGMALYEVVRQRSVAQE
jgi:23S rRNA (guanosine2251-2'-O)-methyltransferase